MMSHYDYFYVVVVIGTFNLNEADGKSQWEFLLGVIFSPKITFSIGYFHSSGRLLCLIFMIVPISL